jgi:hypothetical protein
MIVLLHVLRLGELNLVSGAEDEADDKGVDSADDVIGDKTHGL